MFEKSYTQGEYFKRHPIWHVEDSPWKAKQILKMIKRNGLAPKSICEVGCGAGEILRQLQMKMDQDCLFHGYEISPQAFELCQTRGNEKLNFKMKDILIEKDVFFDLILLIDLIEHLEDYFSFLKGVNPKSVYKILHIPLDLSVQMVLRSRPIMKVREECGHIHYFTKEIAIQTLKDVGYEVLDYFYTPHSVELKNRPLKMRILKLPRKFLFSISKDLAVRILGGYSMMVLVK